MTKKKMLVKKMLGFSPEVCLQSTNVPIQISFLATDTVARRVRNTVPPGGLVGLRKAGFCLAAEKCPSDSVMLLINTHHQKCEFICVCVCVCVIIII